LLHVGICYKSLATHVLHIQFGELEITGNEIRIVVRLVHNLPAVAIQPVTILFCSVVPREFHVFGLHKKHLAGKQFAVNTDLKQAVTCWLQTLGTDFCFIGIQTLMPWYKSLNFSGTYMEVWCVPSATHVHLMP
jgi:hypothetical protein